MQEPDQPVRIIPIEVLQRRVRHEQHHVEMEEKAAGILKRQRRLLRVDPNWKIALVIECEDQMPDAYGRCRWAYLPNKTFEIGLRCDLSDEELSWTIAHEMLEALLSRYAVLFHQHCLAKLNRNQALREVLAEQEAEIRDEFIEHMLLVIGLKRPVRLPTK